MDPFGPIPTGPQNVNEDIININYALYVANATGSTIPTGPTGFTQIFWDIESEQLVYTNREITGPSGNVIIPAGTTGPTGAPRYQNINFGFSTYARNQNWHSVGEIAFTGTDYGTPKKIQAITSVTGNTYQWRVQDLTNVNTIGTTTELTNTTKEITDLGPLSNIPETEARFEFQIRRTSSIGNRRLYMDSANIEY